MMAVAQGKLSEDSVHRLIRLNEKELEVVDSVIISGGRVRITFKVGQTVVREMPRASSASRAYLLTLMKLLDEQVD